MVLAHQEAKKVHSLTSRSSMSFFTLLTDGLSRLPASPLWPYFPTAMEIAVAARPPANRSKYASVSPAFAGRFQNLGGKPHYSARCVNTARQIRFASSTFLKMF